MRENICATLLALSMATLPAFAQDQTATDKRISEIEKKIDELVKEKEAAKKAASPAVDKRAAEPIGLTGFFEKGSFAFSSADGAYKLAFDGRLQLDAAAYRGAENRLPAGAEVRRGRIGFKAAVQKVWLTEVDLDFADSAVAIKDMWAGYGGFANSVIRVGNHKVPFGFDTLASSKYIVFLERAYADSWSPDRRLGASYSHWGPNWEYSAGVFGQPAGTFNDKDAQSGGGAGTSQRANFAARFSYAPLYARGRVLHVGAAAVHMKPDVSKISVSGLDAADRLNASRVVKLDARPETHVSRAKFLSTGDLRYVSHTNMAGLEIAGVFDGVSFQGEYQQAGVKRLSVAAADLRDHTFNSWYGQVSWFPTGDVRPYSPSEGRFGRIIPKKKRGALELALRVSTHDLNDVTAVDPIRGGSATNVTLGANWYMNANHRVMVNVTKVDNDRYAKPGADWAPLGLAPVAGDDFTILAVRYSIAF